MLLLSIVALSAEYTTNLIVEESLYSREAIFSLKVKKAFAAALSDLENDKNPATVQTNLIRELKQHEEEYNQHNRKLFLAFKDENDLKYIELLGTIMKAVRSNPDGNKMFEEVPNGDFLKKFLEFYQSNSEHYNELRPQQQAMIKTIHDQFKIPS